MKFIFLFLFILFSCTKAPEKPSTAEMQIYNEWLYALKLSDLKTNGEIITRPPGVVQLIMTLTIPAEGGINLKTHCVYYQVPYKQIAGELKIEEHKAQTTCPENPQGQSWLELTQLKDFSVKLENFRLSLNFIQKAEKKSWNFLLPNLDNGLIHERYQPVREKKLYSGMMLLRITNESFLNSNNRYLGKITDRFSKGAAIRCHQVDKNCNTVGENRCDDCRYGWYQVVDYQCPQGGSKFCGQNHCGEKNEPACPRGTKVVSEDEMGICQNDLTPVWNADHILLCQ